MHSVLTVTETLKQKESDIHTQSELSRALSSIFKLCVIFLRGTLFLHG
jgi:hypothetical protein